MRRAEVSETELERLADLAAEAGLPLRVHVDLTGEAFFLVQGLGSFVDLESLERALSDHARVSA